MFPTQTVESFATKRMKKEVYVDIPMSPIPLSHYSSLDKPNTPTSQLHISNVATSGLLKENAPLTSINDGMIKSGPTFHKRRLSERDDTSFVFNSLLKTKKQKLTTTRGQEVSPTQPSVYVLIPAASPPLRHPIGAQHCHQCSKKYDTSAFAQCTMQTISVTKGRTTKERRCDGKYCGKCLKNCYGENIEEVKNPSNQKQQRGHAPSTRYTFRCPKCRGICNCQSCGKIKGLKITGKRTHAVASDSSAVQIPAHKSKVLNSKTIVEIPRAPPENLSTVKNTRLKPLSPINWTRIINNLTLDQAEMRFQIREFVLRFSFIMEPPISKTHLEELDRICGPSRSMDDTTGWVSETCVRAIILGVLHILRDNHNVDESIKTAIKAIRASGANLNKMWSALLSLRESLTPTLNSSESPQKPALSFPNPLPSSSSAPVYNTRNMSNSGTITLQVSNSAQMVPILNALIESTFDTDTVREELANGVAEGKKIIREVRERLKREHNEWSIERKHIEQQSQNKHQDPSEETKLKRDTYQQRSQRLENALKTALPRFIPRFVSLGRDKAGRVFYALTPGITERKAALHFITSNTAKAEDTKIKTEMWDEEERKMMKNWSYFVGVWGKKPTYEKQLAGAERTVSHLCCDNPNAGVNTRDDDAESWWGFYQPKDIRNVAEWIASSSVEADEAPDSAIFLLVKNLNEYATLLEWRIQKDKYEITSTAW